MTPEEIAEIEAKLAKIGQNNKILLTKRANKEYTLETLKQTEKFSFLSPDFQTLWNYRREIMVHLFANEVTDVKEQLNMIAEELKFLVKAIMKSPKSYTLWFQRQWAIEKGLDFEATVTNNNTTSMILENELGLCDKMLKMDERNFHCWNYRFWVVDVYIREI